MLNTATIRTALEYVRGDEAREYLTAVKAERSRESALQTALSARRKLLRRPFNPAETVAFCDYCLRAIHGRDARQPAEG